MATILVADDDQLLRAIIRERLEREDHTVLEAGDGIAALEIALEERPECLLLDVMMPLARGLEVVRQVRREEGWDPAIIMISARTRVADRLNALEAGADDYVEKPFEPESLLQLVDLHLATDRRPTRVVDVLEDVWTTLATTRRFVRTRPEPRLDDPLGLLWQQALREVLSEKHEPIPASPNAESVVDALWQLGLRDIVESAIDLPIPMAVDITPPDTLGALFTLVADRTLDAARARTRHAHVATDTIWNEVVTSVVGGRPLGTTVAPAQPDLDRATRWVPGALRRALCGIENADRLSVTWRQALAQVLSADEESTSPGPVDAVGAIWIAMSAAMPVPVTEVTR